MANTEPAELMSSAEMKPLLMLSKRQPINCAIALTTDKQGLILLDRKVKPKAVAALMRKQAAASKFELDIATVRFGRAEVDPSVDSQLVRFVVNKQAPGAMRPRLLEQLKKAGFGKCEIGTDSELDAEPEEEVEQAEEPEAKGPVRHARQEPQPSNQARNNRTEPTRDALDRRGRTEKQDGPDRAPDQDRRTFPPADRADAKQEAALTRRLMELVKQIVPIAKADPSSGDALKAAAMGAQRALKTGDLETASAAADTLEKLLKSQSTASSSPISGSAGKSGGTAVGSVVFGKARAAWLATRRKVEGEVEKLHQTLQAAYKGQGVIVDLEKTFRARVRPVIDRFDETLSDKLDQLAKNSDAAAHRKMVGESRQIIAQYDSFLTGDPLIRKLDGNPFVPLSIQKTLTASLSALSKALA